jgi:hypothetical protein
VISHELARMTAYIELRKSQAATSPAMRDQLAERLQRLRALLERSQSIAGTLQRHREILAKHQKQVRLRLVHGMPTCRMRSLHRRARRRTRLWTRP